MKFAFKIAVFVVVFVYLCINGNKDVYAQSQLKRYQDKKQLYKDSITIAINENRIEHIERYDAFYDSLKNKEYKSWFSRTLARILITNNSYNDGSAPNLEVEVAQDYFDKFQGKEISDINIVRANPFDQNDLSDNHWIDRFLNSLHVITNQRQIEQNLLFKVGEHINAYKMVVNESLLRNLPYLSTAFILIADNPRIPGTVIVSVFTRDTWSISVDASLGNHSWFMLYDRNFIGTGNQLSVKYYPKQSNQLDGVELKYSIDNCWGTFANVDAQVGIGGTYNSAYIYAHKPFIMPSDHFYGLSVGRIQSNESMTTTDTTLNISRNDLAAWYGYSFMLNQNKGTNIFVTSSFDYTKYNKRPLTTHDYNPYYHQRTSVFLSVGIASQNFFQGNMIYGFGRTEDIPYGFKFDITGGIEWNEFLGRRYYIGSSVGWGGITRAGYFELGVSASTYIGKGNATSQTIITSGMRYFSPLARLGTCYFRQFFNVTGTYGLDRMWGEREMISFHDVSTIRGVSIDNAKLGTKRMTLSTESVIFTPIYFYNFRFAFNVWADVGWLGNDRNYFANPMYATAGIGVRVKNERLIFNSFSIRLGFALRLPENTNFNPFRITSEDKINLARFTPTAPRPMEYR